jgi:hypothetical protein
MGIALIGGSGDQQIGSASPSTSAIAIEFGTSMVGRL